MSTPRIVFEDNHFVVIDKPAGFLSQGEKKGDANVVDWLRGLWGRPYVGLVHRLDRNTSGLMVVAKRSKAAGRLTESVKEGKLKRTYRAWLLGRLKKEDVWKDLLLKNEKSNKMTVVKAGKKGAKEAVLRIKPLKESNWQGAAVTLCEVALETGRSHQIRIQAAHRGMPLVGDVKYGRAKQPAGKPFGRPSLHAVKLSFPHPVGGKLMVFETILPEDMAKIERGA